jgi:hypothetical protein
VNEDDPPKLSGMTVNERLSYVGTIDEWEAAARRRDRLKMASLLTEVEIPTPEKIVDAVLVNPKKFGF